MKNFGLALMTACYVFLNGCSHLTEFPDLQTWMQPYERELLADPYMSFSHDPIRQNFRRHVHETREGAKGGYSGTGGGCGCN